MNQHGVDQLFGVGADRDALASEDVPIVYSSTSVHPVIAEHDTLRLVVDNHFAASAQLTIELRIGPA